MEKIAYAKENNLFVYDVTTTTSTPTRDGQKKQYYQRYYGLGL
jgi:hypothetical protein